MLKRGYWVFKDGLPDTIAMAELHLDRPQWDYCDRRWCHMLAGHLSRIPTLEAAELFSQVVLRLKMEAKLN